MPNGRIYIHTGLLGRLDNEAQLATIVGHEMTHVTDRHALSFTRDAQTKPIRFTVAALAASIGVAVAAGSGAGSGDDVGTAVLSQTASAILGLGLRLATVAAISGYGRDLEREADAGGDGEPGPRRLRPEGGAEGLRAAEERVGGAREPRDLLLRQPSQLTERIEATAS